ncbi:MAG: ABC transporter ATP-binding protein [Oscillospiraceae bacterium]|nr:ABC transporter ATP-binding protein [Oscillospiraceae bacterium]
MPILEARSLTKRYGSTPALSNVSFAVEPGRIVGLLGPNGSGKTTLIKLANGLLQPTGGEILIDGEKPGARSKSLISYLPERINVPLWMSAAELIKFYDDFFADFDPARAQEMLRNLGIGEKMRIKEMSKGTREKVQLILAMSRRAKLYMLDEPIGGVDPATRDYILATIISNYDPSASVIISTHLIADVESVLDDALFISRGEIVLYDSVDHIRESRGKSVDGVFREVFRC